MLELETERERMSAAGTLILFCLVISPSILQVCLVVLAVKLV